jgi:hypothetical protein
MKNLIFVFLFLPLVGFVQIKANSQRNKTVVQSTQSIPVVLLQKENQYAALAIVLHDTTCFVEMSGTNIGSATIDVKDLLTIQMENDEQVVLTPVGLQTFVPSLSGNTYKHRYHIDETTILKLNKYSIKNIRKAMWNDHVEFDLPRQASIDIKMQSLAVAAELKKKKRKTKTHPIRIDDIANHIGDSVTFCGNVFITRFFASTKAKAMILDFQNDLSGPKGRVIIWQQDQKKFNLPTKSFFTKKHICVRGLVYLYDGAPYIQVSDPRQITMVDGKKQDNLSL